MRCILGIGFVAGIAARAQHRLAFFALIRRKTGEYNLMSFADVYDGNKAKALHGSGIAYCTIPRGVNAGEWFCLENEAARGIVLRAIDKLDRLGPDGVRALLGEGRKDASGDFTKGAGMDLGVAYEAMAISSGTSFVHETEGQVILNGSRDISFTMDLVAKDIGLFQEVADRAGVPLELNPLLISIFQDGISRFGPRELSPNIIKRLEEATGLDVTAPGFPAEMTDDEPEERGAEVIVKR